MLKDFVDSLVKGMPEQTQDMRSNMEAVVKGAMNKLELVTREEFDIQKKVLERTRQKVTALEEQVAELEEKLKSRDG